MISLLSIVDLVVLRLSGFSYETSPGDRVILKFLSEQVLNDIKADLYVDDIPKELEAGVVNKITSLFLKEKKAIEPESLSTVSLSTPVKTISEGDTSVTFGDVKSNEQRLDEVLTELESGGLKLSCYRRIRW